MAAPRFLPRSRLGRWIIGALVAITLAVGLAIWVLLPAIAARSLTQLLGTPVTITELRFSYFGDRLVARGLTVGQPAGFGDEPILRIGSLSIDGWRGALSAPRELGDVHFEDLHYLHVSRSDQPSNLKTLLHAMRSDDNPDTTSQSGEPFSILIQRATFQAISVTSRNEFKDGDPHELNFAGDELRIDRFSWGRLHGVEPGEIEFTGGLLQPGSQRAEIYFGGRFADVGTGNGSLRLTARVTGCLYQPLVPLVPENAHAVLGGAGFDADVETELAKKAIELNGSIHTSAKSSYQFSLHGPLDAPEVDVPDKLLSVASRMRGGAGRVIQSTLGSGTELAKGSAAAAGDLGKGALSVMGHALKGAGQATLGLLSADKDKAGEGVGSMTVGAGREAKNALGESGEQLTEAGGGTTGALINDPRTQKWLDGVPERHRERIAGLMNALLQESFPPQPEP